MGNYNLLDTVAANLTCEFMPRRLHLFLHEHRLSSSRVAESTRTRP